jgi:hypothetical protein
MIGCFDVWPAHLISIKRFVTLTIVVYPAAKKRRIQHNSTKDEVSEEVQEHKAQSSVNKAKTNDTAPQLLTMALLSGYGSGSESD